MQSTRIELINCNEAIIEAILVGDKKLAELLEVSVPKNWTVFGPSAFLYALEQIQADPNSQEWWTYLPIMLEPRTLIGSCGYKGGADEAGNIEIGYEVAKEYRGQGYATEIAQILIAKAFENEQVKTVQAHTLADENASVRVLRKCNFEKVEEIEDEEEGRIWKWALKKEAYHSSNL